MSPRARTVLYSALTVLVAAVVLEIGASWLMLVYYRAEHVRDFETVDGSYSSLVNLARRAVRLAGTPAPAVVEETEPSPFFRPDPLLGYSAAPGAYTHSWSRRNATTGQWETFRTRVTINPDGTRFVGGERPGKRLGKPTVHIFGDSWVFGTGVPDELTFAGRLYQALPDRNVRLSALGGWALGQAVLNFDRLNGLDLKGVGPHDIVILGYAGYYDVRHVVAPSRLREISTWLDNIGQPIPPFRLPKASRGAEGAVTFSYVDQRCAVLGDYCRQPDPPVSEMTAVTAALVNHIASRTPAKVYLLHFAGGPDEALYRQLDPKVGVIRALRGDFGSVVQDDIMGFDGHPGPYWHYAISRKLLETIDWQSP